MTVTPAPLTITANGVSRVYGASDPTLGVSYSGFVNGETSSVLGGTLSVVDSDAATTTAVGSYAGVITASGQTSTNYTITYVAGNLTVTPAPLTITANGVSRVYGASDPTLGVSYSGFVNGETSSVLGGHLSVVDSEAATTTAVGSYAGVITASGQTSTNYTITYVAGNLTVTPAPLTITANGVSRVYGASDPALGVSYSGFVNGETSSVLGGTLSVVDSEAATTTAVGSYTGVITASGQTSTNYTITYVAGNLTVTPAPLTITANGVSRVYGASDPALGVSYSGFVNGETSSVLGGTLSVVDSEAATTTARGQLHRCDHGLRADLDELYDHLRCRQSDGHAGPAHDHGQWCVASLRCFGPRAWCQLLGIRERRDVQRAGRHVVGCRLGGGHDDSRR